MTAARTLLDDDGENLVLRSFLLYYQNGGDKSVGAMRTHLQLSGWHGCWPDWVARNPDAAHLTKAGAQLWIRHLLALGGTADSPRREAVLHGAIQHGTALTDTQVSAIATRAKQLSASYFGAPDTVALAAIYGTDLVVTLHKEGVL